MNETFFCFRYKCRGMSFRACIARQYAKDTFLWMSDRYPECVHCEQGRQIRESNPRLAAVVARKKALAHAATPSLDDEHLLSVLSGEPIEHSDYAADKDRKEAGRDAA